MALNLQRNYRPVTKKEEKKDIFVVNLTTARAIMLASGLALIIALSIVIGYSAGSPDSEEDELQTNAENIDTQFDYSQIEYRYFQH